MIYCNGNILISQNEKLYIKPLAQMAAKFFLYYVLVSKHQ